MSEKVGFVILRKDNLVSARQWQEAIAANGFTLELHDDVDWEKGAGKVRCSYFGNDARFEFALSPLEDGWLSRMGIASAGDRDTLLTFLLTAEGGHVLLPTVGDYYHWVVTLVAAAVLSELTGGVFVEDLDKLAIGPDVAVAYGRYHEAWIMQFVHDWNFDTMMFMPTPREIMPVLQSPRLKALLARQVEIFASIFKDWKRSDAQRAELGAIEKELRQIVEEGEACLGTNNLRAWLEQRLAKFVNGDGMAKTKPDTSGD